MQIFKVQYISQKSCHPKLCFLYLYSLDSLIMLCKLNDKLSYKNFILIVSWIIGNLKNIHIYYCFRKLRWDGGYCDRPWMDFISGVFPVYMQGKNSVLRFEALSHFCKLSLKSNSLFDNKWSHWPVYKKSKLRPLKEPVLRWR